MSYFKEAEQIHNSQNLSEFCRLKQTKVNCVKSLAPATLVVESSYPYHCLQFTVDPRFFITLVYYVLDHLCLLWKIAVCYFLLVIQSWLFRKIVDCLQFFFIYFQLIVIPTHSIAQCLPYIIHLLLFYSNLSQMGPRSAACLLLSVSKSNLLLDYKLHTEREY